MQDWSFAGLGHLITEYEETGHLGHDEMEKQYHPLSPTEPKYKRDNIRFGMKNKIIKMTSKNHRPLHKKTLKSRVLFPAV